MKGRIHSTESFGTVDGPGIRFVVFLQGCPMRCKYCHNPDTWNTEGGELQDTEDILRDFDACKEFLKNGGITVTGGEPLLQMDFVIELFEKAKKKGIHTCIDTSGITFPNKNQMHYAERIEKFDKLCSVTDLVLLDLKHINSEEHKNLTGVTNERILQFAHYLDLKMVPVWIRHVVIPGITMNDTYLEQLGFFLGGLKNVKALDVLPYHTMGKVKYEQLGISYPLEGVPAMEKGEAAVARNLILKGMKKRLKE